MKKNSLLKKLESEAISIIRDSFSKSLNPVMMYSIGKDSSVLLHLIISLNFHLAAQAGVRYTPDVPG